MELPSALDSLRQELEDFLEEKKDSDIEKIVIIIIIYKNVYHNTCYKQILYIWPFKQGCMIPKICCVSRLTVPLY